MLSLYKILICGPLLLASFTSLLKLVDLDGTSKKTEASWPDPVFSYHYINYTDSTEVNRENSK